MIGMSQSGLSYFEPAFADELAWIMGWSFDQLQAAEGSSVYLRLSTRAIEPPERRIDAALGGDIIAGAYWQRPPAPGAEFAIAYTGAVEPEAMDAIEQLRDDLPGAGLLAVPSPDRLYAEWSRAARGGRAKGAAGVCHVERLLGRLAPDAAIVTVIDGHPATLSWLGSVAGHRTYPLGVTAFGQSGDIADLYRIHGLDADAILDACANACLDRLRRRPAALEPYLA
jgi:pyruvate dehydrogenase E1 component